MSETPETLPPGTILDGSYRLQRLIGLGGMGAVYEATMVRGGKRVAVKVMSRGMMAYPEALARFKREVKVTTELQHPNIVEVVGFGFAATGEPYLAMEFLEGEDLGSRLARSGPVPLAEAAQIVTQLASALAVAHAEGVVHRDLKPDNVFLVARSDGGVFVKVVDFGISKVLKASTTQLTVARAVFGTPEFMAPEQAAGLIEKIDHRSDQWSLACIAWFMVSGHLPFNRPDVQATLNQVAAEDPTPLPPGTTPFPPEVDKVLRRAMSKRRSDRFPTVRSFARAFDAAVTGQPVRPTGKETPLAERVPRQETPPPKPRSAFGTWLAVMLVAAGLLAAVWYFRAQLPLPDWFPGR